MLFYMMSHCAQKIKVAKSGELTAQALANVTDLHIVKNWIKNLLSFHACLWTLVLCILYLRIRHTVHPSKYVTT